MELKIDKSELVNLTATAGAAVAAKSYIPILGGIKITADIGGTITAEGSDANMNIKVSGTADVTESGTVVIDASMLDGIAKRLNNGTIKITTDDTKATFESGKSRFEILILDAKAYPSYETVEEKYKITFPASKFKHIIDKATPFAVATESKKPTLQGVLFEVSGGDLCAVATDGFRLAYIPTGVNQDCPDRQFIIPANQLRELAKIISDVDGDICAVSDGRNFTFTCGNYMVFLRLLEGAYISYKPLLKRKADITATVNKREFADVIERASLAASSERVKTGKVPTVFDVCEDRIEISCQTKQMSVSDSVEADVEGSGARIGFNADYVKTMLKAYTKDECMLEMSGGTAPCIMRDADGSVYLVLPVRI